MQNAQNSLKSGTWSTEKEAGHSAAERPGSARAGQGKPGCAPERTGSARASLAVLLRGRSQEARTLPTSPSPSSEWHFSERRQCVGFWRTDLVVFPLMMNLTPGDTVSDFSLRNKKAKEVPGEASCAGCLQGNELSRMRMMQGTVWSPEKKRTNIKENLVNFLLLLTLDLLNYRLTRGVGGVCAAFCMEWW